MIHNGRNKQNDAYFVMSLSTCIWCASLAPMLLYKVMYVLVPILGMIVWALRVYGETYEIVETKYGYFYKDKVCLINFIWYGYIFLLAIGAIHRNKKVL